MDALGETLEDSIRREVAEEVGLTVRSIDYKVSQHWSFPTSNLMIGCHAVVDGELKSPTYFNVETEMFFISAIAA